MHCTGSSLGLHYDVIAEYSKYISEIVPLYGDAFDDVTLNLKNFKNVLSNYSGDKVLLHHDNSERSPFCFENKHGDTIELFLLAVMLK